MNWRWTWVNFVVSLLINRVRFLLDEGLIQLYAWIAHYPGADTWLSARHIDFYSGALLVAAILALFHLRPLVYGVLLPSMPGVAHVLQDDQVVPLVDVPAQGLTRKVCLLDKNEIAITMFTGHSWHGKCSSPSHFLSLLSLSLPYSPLSSFPWTRRVESGSRARSRGY